MARQVINTDPPIGDPAPTAFNKINAMTAELYPLATGALSKSGGRITGELLVGAAAGGWRMVSDGANCYMDARANVTSSTLPDGNALYRATDHRFTNNTGNVIVTINGAGSITAGGAVSAASAIVSGSGGIVSQGSGAGYQFVDRQDFAQTWAWFATGNILSCWNNTQGGVMTVSRSGVVTATQFTPISSADVKDYIEGYSGDADAELDRMVVIEYQYRPEFVQSDRRFVGLLAENVADVHGSASNPEEEVWTQIEVERLVDVEYPREVAREVSVLTPVENFDPEDPQYIQTTENVVEIVMETRQELRKVMEAKKTTKPRSVDMMQILALAVRAHQQKSKRIRDLEVMVATALRRIEALESGA